jgi:membrane protein implicated in regulation of membrane protease activity
MVALFAFALILGGGLLLVSLLGDLFGGHGDLGSDVDTDLGLDVDTDLDLDVDTDLGLDVDTDLDLDADAGESLTASPDAEIGSGDLHLSDAVRIFTIRNLTYFLFGFGGVGTMLHWLSPGLPLWVTTLAAVAAGSLAAGVVALAFGYMRATESGALLGEDSFVGCEARVVLPMREGRVGQVMVRRGDREYELRALPFDARAAEPERWRRVVVIEMDGGTARVGPLEELASSDADPAGAT